jgi:hypothetical protein
MQEERGSVVGDKKRNILANIRLMLSSFVEFKKFKKHNKVYVWG